MNSSGHTLYGLSSYPRTPPLTGRWLIWSHVLVALAALLVGMALGRSSANGPPGKSRIDWPKLVAPHPRSLEP